MTVNPVPIVLIVALARNDVIGRGNTLPWRLSTDLKRFRALTLGCPLIMGRKTFQSIGKPLPGRESIVLSRNFTAPGTLAARSVEEALEQAKRAVNHLDAPRICVIGGGEIYRLMLPLCDILHLTRVEAEPEGDAFFPDYEPDDFEEIFRETHPAGPQDAYPFTFIDLKRRITC